MNHSEFVAAISEKAGLTKKDVTRVLDTYAEIVGTQLASDDSVSHKDFAIYGVSLRSARKGRHPQTGAEINIPASKVVRFKPSKPLREQVK